MLDEGADSRASGMKARVRSEVRSFAGGKSDEFPCSKWDPRRSTYQQRRVAAHSQRVNGIRSCQVMSHVCTPGANLSACLALVAATRGSVGRLELEVAAKLPK